MSIFLYESKNTNTFYINVTISVYIMNFSCSLLLKLPIFENNSTHLNFLVCRSIPWPLRIYSLFFFFISSKIISGINFTINKYKEGSLKPGKTSPAKRSGNKFLPEAVAMFMTEPKSKSNKKIINNYCYV